MAGTPVSWPLHRVVVRRREQGGLAGLRRRPQWFCLLRDVLLVDAVFHFFLNPGNLRRLLLLNRIGEHFEQAGEVSPVVVEASEETLARWLSGADRLLGV